MSAEVEMERPTAGTSYPMTLGDTLLQEQPGHSYCSLRYDFKPASAARFRPGSLQLLPEHGQAELSLPDAAMEDGDMAFSGRYERSRDGLDCVAIFDGATWRLELLDGLVKGLRTTTRRYVPAATPPPQAAHEVEPDADMADDLDADMAFELEAALQGHGAEKLSLWPALQPEALEPLPQQPVLDTAARPQPLPQEPNQATPSQLHRPEQDTAAAAGSRAAVDADQGDDEDARGNNEGGDRGGNDAVVQADSPPPRVQPDDEDVPEWERDFYKAPDSEDDDDDDEHLNHCSDDDSDIGIEHF